MEPEKSTIIPGRIENLTKKTGYQKPGAAKHASLQPYSSCMYRDWTSQI